MRRFWIILVLMLISCRALAPAGLNPTAADPLGVLPNMPGSTPGPPATAAPHPDAAVRPEYPEQPFTVRFHPDGPLYAGDRISLEVIVEQGGRRFDSVRAWLTGEGEEALGSAELQRFGIGGRLQANLMWAWDTTGLLPGEYTLRFEALPGGESWTERVRLEARPADLAEHEWALAENECCTVHYITGTDAARDLPALLDDIDRQAADAEQKLGLDLSEPIDIVLLPRVLGQGGFTREEISVSYLDENYAGGDPSMVLHHELVHYLDAQLGGDLRPLFLVEGLAVYLSGGHFKPEPLMLRAAALLPPQTGCAYGADPAACGLGWYIPLETLAQDFYASQHEIGYLQAGALVEYMVERWGWTEFSAFYRDIHAPPGGDQDRTVDQAEAVDRALLSHFNLTFAELEADFIAALRTEPVTASLVEDVRLSVTFYEAVRRYQLALDPSAYFRSAWLPDGEQMRQQGIVADYLRRPQEPKNRLLEDLLVSADRALDAGDYSAASEQLSVIGALLDVYTGRTTPGET